MPKRRSIARVASAHSRMVRTRARASRTNGPCRRATARRHSSVGIVRQDVPDGALVGRHRPHRAVRFDLQHRQAHARVKQLVLRERMGALGGAAAAVPLSARERDIALMAARGRTSRETAETYVLSVRTVENHLGRICRKLGVSGRADLADVLLARPSRARPAPCRPHGAGQAPTLLRHTTGQARTPLPCGAYRSRRRTRVTWRRWARIAPTQ
ncbi:helix-turn-helix transcriptional regulator [Streptomyces sp. NPDC006197]|uniref:helix-turn-helix transcriptional regulator n=1 Tax=Streptomyces sp. NPDC006197 TaxID=3156685 RepID=UPI0033BD9605